MNKSKLQLRMRGTGMTQAEFADAIGVSLSALSNYMRGTREWSVSQMVRGAEVLGLSAAEAVELFGPPLSGRQRQIMMGGAGNG